MKYNPVVSNSAASNQTTKMSILKSIHTAKNIQVSIVNSGMTLKDANDNARMYNAENFDRFTNYNVVTDGEAKELLATIA